MQAQEAISRERLQAKVGTTMRILIDKIDPRSAVGRSAADAPEIDGAVHVKRTLAQRNKFTVGQFVDVKITSADEHDLRGELA